jgi:hypothetical protein
MDAPPPARPRAAEEQLPPPFGYSMAIQRVQHGLGEEEAPVWVNGRPCGNLEVSQKNGRHVGHSCSDCFSHVLRRGQPTGLNGPTWL